MGAPNKKNAADPSESQKLSRSEEFRKQEDSRTGSRRYISWPRLNVLVIPRSPRRPRDIAPLSSASSP